MNKPLLLPVGLTLLLFFTGFTNLWASSFQQTVEQLLPDDGQRFGRLSSGETLYGKFFIKRMYEENDHSPLWRPATIESLAKALNSLENDGLIPEDYRFPAIRPYLDRPSRSHHSLQEAVLVDILLTETYLRAMYNLYYGKTDPVRLDSNNNFARARDGKDRSPFLLSWISKGDIEAAFEWARPKNERYQWMKKALQRYQAIKDAGGWTPIPKGKTIRPSDSDSRIGLIRKRLAMTDDLATETGSNINDESLQDGVIKFQERHYLTVDGVIGPGTLAAMNVPVSQRIDQLRVNMERQRWLFPEEAEEFLIVDIAGFTIFWIKQGEIVWQEQVQVGKKFTKTPIFKDKIRYIDFNPTWTIPPGIKKRTILPALKRDPGYLAKKGYKLLTLNGKPVDPYSVDWKSLSSMPYVVRQPARKNNALGQVKFMFPNKHHVFLHDTNHREYFNKEVRTTSSGCIRLNNPFDLAEALLAPQGWNRARIDKVVASGKTTRVRLQKPMPILIHYNTAWTVGQEVSFKNDIYKRDAKLLAALNGPFVFHTPDLAKGNPTIREPNHEAPDIPVETTKPPVWQSPSPGFLDL